MMDLKSKSRVWLIVLGLAFVIAIVLLFTLFKKKAMVNQDYLYKVDYLDSIIKNQQESIKTLKNYNAVQDSLINTYNEEYKNNRQKETIIIHKYEKIPVDIRALDRESLRREVTNFR